MYNQEMIQQLTQCVDDPAYFMNRFIILPQNPMVVSERQLYWLEQLKTEKEIFTGTDRSLGRTTFAVAYALWTMIFNSNKTIVFVGNTYRQISDAAEMFNNMILGLPDWFQVQPLVNNKRIKQFDNGSSIRFETPGPYTARGLTINMLILDDFDDWNLRQREELLSKLYPVVAAVTQKVIINGGSYYTSAGTNSQPI